MTVGRRRALGILLAAMIGGLRPGMAHAGRAVLNVTVPVGKWKAVRLRNLPLNALVSLDIQADGNIDVIFIHQDELAKFPAAVNPAFQGSVERAMTFKVVIHKPGNYHVIVDNRKGGTERKVRLDIQAQNGAKERDDTVPLKPETKSKPQRI